MNDVVNKLCISNDLLKNLYCLFDLKKFTHISPGANSKEIIGFF